MIVFNWDKVREELKPSPTRDKLISHAFQQWLDGNGYGERSKPEIDHYFSLFQAGWVICESFNK